MLLSVFGTFYRFCNYNSKAMFLRLIVNLWRVYFHLSLYYRP